MAGRTRRKNVLVLWSGGLDSTYLLQKCLTDERNRTVLAGYVQIHNNHRKSAAEVAAIAQLLPELRKSPKFVFLGELLSVSVPQKNPRLRFEQMPVWLLAAVTAVPKRVDEIALGYVRTDEAALHLDHLQRIYRGYRPLFRRAPPKLVFPLSRLSKADVARRMRPELLARCFSCDAPRVRLGRHVACGTCHACRRRLIELGTLG